MTIGNVSGKSILNALNNAQNDLSKANERLSSGKRINKAIDDPAGVAVVAQLTGELAKLGKASDNVSYASSYAAIADSSLEQISQISQRQAELATQAANGTLTDADRQVLDQEFQQLSQESQRITATAQFNGKNVLSSGSTSIQVGTDSSSESQIAIEGGDPGVASLSGLSIGTVEGAQAAVEGITQFISDTAGVRGAIGAVSSRFDAAAQNIESTKVELAASQSRIQDADVAAEVANRTSAGIRQQASAAISAQANNLSADIVKRLIQ